MGSGANCRSNEIMNLRLTYFDTTFEDLIDGAGSQLPM